MKLKIDQIIIDQKLNPRCDGLDLVTVAEYAEAMQRGDSFPPIDVFTDDISYWVVDGFHRIAAAKQIEVNIHSGSWRDAQLFTFQVNAKHGKPRTNADKHYAVTIMLMDAEWGAWSDSEIAKRCKVSQPFVSNLKKELLTYNIISEKTKRTYVTKHGTVSTMSSPTPSAYGKRRI